MMKTIARTLPPFSPPRDTILIQGWTILRGTSSLRLPSGAAEFGRACSSLFFTNYTRTHAYIHAHIHAERQTKVQRALAPSRPWTAMMRSGIIIFHEANLELARAIPLAPSRRARDGIEEAEVDQRHDDDDGRRPDIAYKITHQTFLRVRVPQAYDERGTGEERRRTS